MLARLLPEIDIRSSVAVFPFQPVELEKISTAALRRAGGVARDAVENGLRQRGYESHQSSFQLQSLPIRHDQHRNEGCPSIGAEKASVGGGRAATYEYVSLTPSGILITRRRPRATGPAQPVERARNPRAVAQGSKPWIHLYLVGNHEDVMRGSSDSE